MRSREKGKGHSVRMNFDRQLGVGAVLEKQLGDVVMTVDDGRV